MATYVVGDIHGCLFTLRNLLEDKIGLNKTDRLYLLGDYIDRGPMSCQSVEYLVNLRDQGYSIYPLRGNHEQMILDSASDLYAYKLWLLNAGNATLKSYIQTIGSHFTYPNGIPPRHMEFFNSLEHYYVISNYFILVHGALNTAIADPFSDTERMLWGRPKETDGEILNNRVLLYGHTPTPLYTIKRKVEESDPKMIPLDAGCVYTSGSLGNLAALELEKMKLYFSPRIDEGFSR